MSLSAAGGARITTLGDAELISATRNGDEEAAAELFERHRDAALRLGVALTGRTQAEDLVSEAFVRVLAALKNGRGPERAFRPYLLSTIRNLFIDELRRTGREIPVDEFSPELLDVAEPDQFEARFDSTAMARAFRSLPSRWQEVLWHTSVEDDSLAVVAKHLGMNANSVAALSFRAREGLRRAYLAEHLAEGADKSCAWVLQRLPRRARGGLSEVEARRLEEHLDTCATCPAAVIELGAINSQLGALLLPALVGSAVPLRAYLGTSWWSTVTSAVGGAGTAAVGGVGIAAAATVAVVVSLGAVDATPVADQSTSAFASPVSPAEASSASRAPRQSVQAAPSLRAKPSPSLTPSPSPASSPPVITPPVVTTAPARPQRFAGVSVPPTSVPSTPVPAPQADVALGQPWQREADSPRRGTHIEVPVEADGAAVVLRVTMTGIATYDVHADGAYGGWTCQPDSGNLVLECTLPAGDATPRRFAVDVALVPGQDAHLAFELSAVDRADPHPGDSQVSVDVERHDQEER